MADAMATTIGNGVTRVSAAAGGMAGWSEAAGMIGTRETGHHGGKGGEKTRIRDGINGDVQDQAMLLWTMCGMVSGNESTDAPWSAKQ